MGTQKHPEKTRAFNTLQTKDRKKRCDFNSKHKERMKTIDKMSEGGVNIRTYGCNRKLDKEV